MPGIPSQPNNIPLASSLPKVSFRKVPPDEALIFHIAPGIIDSHAIPFGYNDGKDFAKTNSYIRYLEPVESELKKQVEYDMDEQDQEWLDALNHDRRSQGLDSISYDVFEIILDQLEKEWFDLMKRVPPKARHGAGADAAGDGADADDANSDDGEDSKCAICDDGECENSNAIVFCDGCNLAVHQDCYGIPYIPEGQWLCRKCTVSPDRAVSCILCPHEGGAFKQTTTGKWAHLLCAMWIPETGVSNPVYMEPIDSVERIPKARWKLQCYLCRYRMGACIQCDRSSCFTAFHVTCARKAGLLFRTERTRVSHHLYEDSDGSDDEGPEVLRACCHRHMPPEMRDQFKIDFGRQTALEDERSETSYRASPFVASRTRELSVESGMGAPLISVSRRSSTVGSHDGASPATDQKNTSKSARAYKKSFKAGPPLVPAYIANRVLEYITKIHLRKKATALQLIARYWSLKREARRGAPLLKRLHLEPWTASSQNKEQTDAQKGKKLHFLRSIRGDLERVRMLVEQVRKREKEKLRQAQEIRNSLVEPVLFPFHADLRAAIAKFEVVDKHDFFAAPVSKVDVPDYYDIIKEPMDWLTIKDKIANKVYQTVEEMRQDVLKIASNSMIYNKPDTPYHKAASKILKMIPEVFEELGAIEKSHLRVHENRMNKQQQQQQQEQQQATQEEEPSEQDVDASPPTTQTPYTVDAKSRLQLLGLGFEPPSDLVSLLRDYRLMEDEEQTEIRQQAYGTHPMPPTTQMKSEERGHSEEEQADTFGDHPRGQATPITNLIEDFVHEVYVPAPPPTPPARVSPVSSTSKKQKTVKTPATTDSAENATPKVPRKRKASNTEPAAPVERRSTCRSIALEATPTAEAEAEKTQEPTAKSDPVTSARSRRLRAQSTAKPASTENAGPRSANEAGAMPMTQSKSQTSAVAPDDIHVEGDVGEHDSFKRFNTGWIYSDGSKRNRTSANPEMIGKVPRKISAPESPAPKEVSKITGQTAAATPQQRPRSRTVPSSSRQTESTPAAARTKRQSSARRGSEPKQESKNEEEISTAASSPLTSDDEGEKDAGPAPQSKQTRSKRTRERQASHASEGPSEAATSETAAAPRRSTRTRTASTEPPTSPSASKRARTASKSSVDFATNPPPSGTKVWAKMDGYAHFPAAIVTNKAKIPGDVARARPKGGENLIAVRFFGKRASWGWVEPNKLALLLVDEGEDESYLKLAAKRGQTREVREAYEDAKSRS